VRRESAHRKNGTEPRCQLCRRPPVTLSDAERRKLEAWWLERMTLAELRELADAIWQ
jgi:hypothetical protein